MKLVILALALLIGSACMSQGFFKAVPKVKFKYSATQLSVVADSVQNAFRPITNIAAYAEPGNILMAGAGISYQHLKWVPSTQKWNCEWSVSGMAWAGGSVAPKTPTDIISYGIMLGVLNNLIMVGPALNAGKVVGVVSIGINLNN